MADLIDRQAALLEGVDANISHLRDIVGGDSMLNRVINLLQYTRDFIAVQTAVDAVEVVRCKDCKHYKRGIVFKDTMFCFRPDENGGAYVIRSEDNNFCSYGERRGDDAAEDL